MFRYSQQDLQWKEKLLGWSQSLTIGQSGCLLACLAMACRKFGYPEDLYSLNEKMKVNSGYWDEDLLVVRQISAAVPGMKQVWAFEVAADELAPLSDINSYLDQDYVVIIELDRSPAPGMQNHWVILEKRLGADDYYIVDPWPLAENGAPPTLLDRYGFGKTAGEVIRYIYVVSGNLTTDITESTVGCLTPAEHAANATGTLLVVAPLGANLRSSPLLADNLIASVPAGYELKAAPLEDVVQGGITWAPVVVWVARVDREGTVLVE